jgi:predicted ATPase/class 3 adenylate cyclase
MSALPAGTVSFLFTDIEDSTKLVRELGSDWGALLERERRIIRDAVAASNGIEVDSSGDAVFAVFTSAAEAVEAASTAQRALAAEVWPPAVRVRVRMGIHTGIGEVRDGGYVGFDVHRAARIANAAHGGQVIVSSTTRALLGQGVDLRDLGEQRLKDLPDPERLYQVRIDGLDEEFAPLRTSVATPNNVPSRLTELIGRGREIEEVLELLERHRLVTLSGPGGTGKTRLALEVAARCLDAFPGGVWFVELAPITEAGLVPTVVATRMGLPDRGGASAVDRLVEHIGDRRVAIVLDNLEHLLGCAQAVSELLAHAKELRIISTSRSPLHVYGEYEYAVPTLGLPDLDRLIDLDALAAEESVALFVERARAVRRDFALTRDNALAIAEICVRLDGLPLAIELAAGRVKLFSPAAILARFRDRLELPAPGSADAPDRQRTLRATIEWSYGLLESDERDLFATLSVFAGGANLDAIEQVCCAEDHAGPEVVDVLLSLVDKNLLRRSEDADGGPRFAMLETIRQFAAERLGAEGRLEAVRRRHAEHYLVRAEEASAEIMGPEMGHWLDRLELDHDNIRAAFGWALEAGRADVALGLATAMWRFWQMRGHLSEGRSRAERALAIEGAAEHPAQRAAAADAAGSLAYWANDAEAAGRWYGQALDAYRELGDRVGVATQLYNLSSGLNSRLPFTMSDGIAARDMLTEALAIFDELGDRGGEARALWALSLNDLRAGRLREGTVHAGRALAYFEEVNDAFMIPWSEYMLAFAEVAQDDLDPARRRLLRCLRMFRSVRDLSGYSTILNCIATVEERAGERPSAARISGAVAALDAVAGTGIKNVWNLDLGFDPLALRDDPATEDAWHEGERMGVDAVVAIVLEEEQPISASL